MNVLFVGKVPQPLFWVGEHSHSCWEIVIVTQGGGRVDTAKERVTFAANTVYILPPHTPHTVQSENGFLDVYLHVDTLPFSHTEITCVTDTEEFSLLAELMHTLYQKGASRQAALVSLAELTVQLTADRLAESGGHPVSLLLRDYLAQHIADPKISMQTLAAQFSYTDDHLRRCFKADFHTTPLEYLFALRLQKAKQLLRRMPVWSVTEIAQQCGFADPLYFSRMFKKCVGCSPREYRNTK